MDGPVCPSWQSFQESSVDRIVWRLLRIAINGNLREGCLRTIENIRRWWCGTTNPGLVAYVRDHSSKIKWYQAVIFLALSHPPLYLYHQAPPARIRRMPTHPIQSGGTAIPHLTGVCCQPTAYKMCDEHASRRGPQKEHTARAENLTPRYVRHDDGQKE